MKKISIGAPVRKIKGSEWRGIVCGQYCTALTPEGWAVESHTERGSVQIYPAAALEYDTAVSEWMTKHPGQRVDVAALAEIDAGNEGLTLEQFRQQVTEAARAPLLARIAEIEAARFAYAREFGQNEDGQPDVGNIHANIRAMKGRVSHLEQACRYEADLCQQALDSRERAEARIVGLEQALIKESARTADAVQRADHFEQRLNMANALGNAAREELAQLTTRAEALHAKCDLMGKRLIHSMNHMSENDRHAYGRHVLYIGGIGDLSDICSFIDPRLKIKQPTQAR